MLMSSLAGMLLSKAKMHVEQLFKADPSADAIEVIREQQFWVFTAYVEDMINARASPK